MGLLYTGSRFFPMACVSGYNRVPDPPARMMPLYCVLSFISSFCLSPRAPLRLPGIVRGNPLPVVPARHIPHPGFILKIPANRLPNPALERFLRLPSQFAFDLAGVHGIAPVVAGTILHVRDECPPGAFRTWRKLIHQVADRLHDFDIRFLVPTADVICLSRPPAPQHGCDGCAVILDVKPVPDILPITVNRKRFAIPRVE